MSAVLASSGQPEVDQHPCVLDVVLPVYNEERVLEASTRRLREYLDDAVPFSSVITIADNASTDNTWVEASHLARVTPGVRATHVAQKGRGRALRAAWGASASPVLVYMDIDLSTDLAALPALVAPLISGHSDLGIGTRLAPGAQVTRGPKREVISRIYNFLVRTSQHSRFTDAQCGFKAIRRDAAARLLPLVQDNEWFFDTELLLLAEHEGLRIHEVPVRWVEDTDSRVHIASAAVSDVRGLARMRRSWGPSRPPGSGPRA